MNKVFPNGFRNWAETHHEIVSMITLMMDNDNYPKKLEDTQIQHGSGGIWDLCIDLTDKFELENKDREWDGEYYEEIENFIEKEIN